MKNYLKALALLTCLTNHPELSVAQQMSSASVPGTGGDPYGSVYSGGGFGYGDSGAGGMSGPTVRISPAKAKLTEEISILKERLNSKDLSPRQRELALEKLKQVLTRYFETDMGERLQRFNQVKTQLDTIEKKLQDRIAKKEAIIELQLNQIMLQSEGLDIDIPASPLLSDAYSSGFGASSGPSFSRRQTDPQKSFGYDSRFGFTNAMRYSMDTLDEEDPVKDYSALPLDKPASSKSNVESLKAIILAWHIFHDRFHHFPCSSNTLVDGQPPHSWRVVILPLLGYGDLYAQYNFDEPWDSENNLKLADKMPQIYAHEGKMGAHTTRFKAVTASIDPKSKSIPISLGDISDGIANTIAIIESDTEVHWLKPEDIEIKENSILPKLGQSRVVSLYDGSCHQLNPQYYTHQNAYRALFTINGGEVINRKGVFDKPE